MIKRTLYFGNPAYLNLKNQQLVINKPDTEKPITIPIEDVGLLILDHNQITITQNLICKLLHNNVAIVSCDNRHHPLGLMLTIEGHTLQSQRYQSQIEATVPLKKKLWQYTVQAKVCNQAGVLALLNKEYADYLLQLSKQVKSGDTGNIEARAAVYYWSHLFPDIPQFVRDRFGSPPNAILNYGYAILRAIVARALVGSGLIPTLGIFHRNQYNAYCLADDIMEPYRPYVDKIVLQLIQEGKDVTEVTPELKKILLNIPAIDVSIDSVTSPLMNAVSRTTASLAKCFAGDIQKPIYPKL